MTTVTPGIFIVDDHPLVRDALARMLIGEGFEVRGAAGDAKETLAHSMLKSSQLAIVDLTLGDQNGIELIRQLRTLEMRVLVYSMHEESNWVRRALEAGAEGYVTKRESALSLIKGIHTVIAGGRYMSPRVAAALEEVSALDTLSQQQFLVFTLLGQGLANEEIATRLEIGVRTLESYYIRIMDKLGVNGTKELRRLATRDFAASNK